MQSVGDHGVARCPDEVVMDTAEAIIAIHGHRFDYLALAISRESWASFDLTLNSTDFSDANVLIEG